ncbi:MAG: 2-C-methyl-D-erythritol 2,4-cyclodiphosphate synthase, partial [Oscillospiraceae bacterium]|nr:2-C-methyl-D-erythritol 2,4-cyclodiphosphate synthase [Oscillospiraceae bacterium]
IGRHFPDSDERYRGISSILLLEKVAEKLSEAGFKLGNLDITVIAQRPKLAPHIEMRERNLAAALGAEIGQINIKATTEEKLGFTGSGEGIAAHAVVLIMPIN